MGWIHSVPEKESASRLEKLGADSLECKLPEANQFVINAWMELGLALSGGFGLMPLTYLEITAFSEARCYDLTPLEFKQIRSMSQQYCTWTNKGKDINCPSPFISEDEDDIAANRRKVVSQMQAFRQAHS